MAWSFRVWEGRKGDMIEIDEGYLYVSCIIYNVAPFREEYKAKVLVDKVNIRMILWVMLMLLVFPSCHFSPQYLELRSEAWGLISLPVSQTCWPLAVFLIPLA